MDPLVKYLRYGDLLTDKYEARKLVVKAARYLIHDNALYKRGYMVPLLRCVPHSQVESILFELHKGICGGHPG